MEENEVKFIQASLLDILPYLPVRIIDEMDSDHNMLTEKVVTDATFHTMKEHRGGSIQTIEYLAFHTEKDRSRKPEHSWWTVGNARNALGGMVVFLTLQEAERIGVAYHYEQKYPGWMRTSDTFDKSSGDQRPAARKSVQAIIYKEEAHV